MPDFTGWDNFPILSGLSGLLGLQASAVAMAMVAATIGSLIMSRFTLVLGPFSYVVNYVVLLAGALVSNVTMARVSASLDNSLERSLMISLAGMVVASLLLVAVLALGKLRG